MNERRRQDAQKFIPRDKLVSLDAVELPVLPQSVIESGPEDSYNYAWVSALMDQVLSEIKLKCRKQDMETHWYVFRERVVVPMLNNAAPKSLGDICQEYGIESEKKASNMIITIKRRFQSTLKQYIRNTVVSENQMNDELKEIMKFFPKKAQHSQ
jgi:hypothetical protein